MGCGLTHPRMKPQNLAELVSTSGRGRAFMIGALAGAALVCLAPSSFAEPAPPRDPKATDVTVLTSPPDARVAMAGTSQVNGTAPLDVPALLQGRYSVTLSALGHSNSQGVLFIPPRGGRPYLLSEPPGLTGGLLLRSLNFPGGPDISSGHMERGLALAVAAGGGALAAIRANIFYLDDVDELDPGSGYDARDWRYQRQIWAAYVGGVWMMSALDYIVRARVDLIESTPTRITLGAPPVTRGSVVLRSILVPGAGQEFANRRTRSSFWLGGALASSAAWVVATDSHHRIETDLEQARANLAAASPSDEPAREAELAHFTVKESHSKELTRNLGYLALLVYGSNLIDAMIMPLHSPASPAPSRVSLSVPASPEGVQLAVNCRF